MCRHEESVLARAPKHSSQNISREAFGKAWAKSTASSSKPRPTSPPSAVYSPESTPLAAAAPPKRPASSAASLPRSKQTTVGPPDENAQGSRGHVRGRQIRWPSRREAGRREQRVCFGTCATFLVTISREFPPRKCYS